MSKEDFEKLANEIAEKANECCNRSDGFEEDIRSGVLEGLEKVVNLPQWISFKDQEPPLQTPPKAPFGIPVLVTDGKEIVVAAWGLKPESSPFTLIFGKYEVGRPKPEWWMGEMELTHWMALPDLPEKERTLCRESLAQTT